MAHPGAADATVIGPAPAFQPPRRRRGPVLAALGGAAVLAAAAGAIVMTLPRPAPPPVAVAAPPAPAPAPAAVVEPPTPDPGLAEALAREQARQQAEAEAQRQAAEDARRQQRQRVAAAAGPLREALGRLPCTVLSVDATDTALMISGARGEGGAEAELRTVLDGAGVATLVRIEPISSILCKPLKAIERLRDLRSAADQMVAVRPAVAGAIYKKGDTLVVDLINRGAATALQVDYFTVTGDVIHLLPNAKERDNRLAADARRRLGDPQGGGRFWMMGEPYGHELVVAIASPRPLFEAPRPETESAHRYLPELRKALDAAAKGPLPTPSATALVITIVPD
jgi:hypothetical protein